MCGLDEAVACNWLDAIHTVVFERWKLEHQLMAAVKKLDEYWRVLVALLATNGTAICEHVASVDPNYAFYGIFTPSVGRQ